MRNKRIGLVTVLVFLTLLTLLFTGCQNNNSDSIIDSSSQIYDNSDSNNELTSGENVTDKNTTDSALENGNIPMESTQTANIQTVNQEKTQSNTNLSGKLTIDDYMTMNDSLENFTAFVNRRTDFTANQKKQIIEARTRQLEINDALMAEYKKILTEEEMKAYLVQPAGEALETGMVPTNDAYNRAVQKINQAKSSDTEAARLTKELSQVKGGILGTFVDKVQKEKSKLLGF